MSSDSGKRVTGSYKLRVGSWNIGSLTGKSVELVKILKKRRINIACVQETKWVDYEDLDEVVRGIPNTEKIVIGRDFNGHIGATSSGFDDVHGGFGVRERNGGGTSLLDFAKAFELGDKGLCIRLSQVKILLPHKLLVMDLEIKRDRRKKLVSLTKD
ncbi:hypothetical protein H5410_034936 [Solanum commersonii]|uniref:Craniofacial development protein 2-like n=1 Tax=Solanum commersonii TaxID=4109 RepID=A0A9J5Y2D4_SOLCO|nr:hypothetical protein H5410_034936 [Solanum commersonii]